MSKRDQTVLTKDQQARVDKARKAGAFNINGGEGNPNRMKKRSWWSRYKTVTVSNDNVALAAAA